MYLSFALIKGATFYMICTRLTTVDQSFSNLITHVPTNYGEIRFIFNYEYKSFKVTNDVMKLQCHIE